MLPTEVYYCRGSCRRRWLPHRRLCRRRCRRCPARDCSWSPSGVVGIEGVQDRQRRGFLHPRDRQFPGTHNRAGKTAPASDPPRRDTRIPEQGMTERRSDQGRRRGVLGGAAKPEGQSCRTEPLAGSISFTSEGPSPETGEFCRRLPHGNGHEEA